MQDNNSKPPVFNQAQKFRILLSPFSRVFGKISDNRSGEHFPLTGNLVCVTCAGLRTRRDLSLRVIFQYLRTVGTIYHYHLVWEHYSLTISYTHFVRILEVRSYVPKAASGLLGIIRRNP